MSRYPFILAISIELLGNCKRSEVGGGHPAPSGRQGTSSLVPAFLAFPVSPS